MGIGLVRTKVMAVLLGTTGFGLFSLFWNISELARIVAGMGINNSGVRQIAEAVGSGDEQRVARTVTTLRRVSIILGIVGALLLLALCVPVSRVSFGYSSHASAILLLSLAVLFVALPQGQVALIQGMRRIADLARNSVLGAFFGLVASIPLIYRYRERGVVPALVCSAFFGIVTSWWFSRKIKIQPVSMSASEVRREASGLLNLGFVFMTSALMSTGVAYVIQLIVLWNIGAETGVEAGKAALGCYSAAWMMGGYYVTFILQAMGADFYPRLSAAANDNKECNRLVNEQAEISLLLAGPGMLATLTIAPLVIQLFFSAKFEAAVEVLRWICLGMMLRVVTWPIGFVIMAKGARRVFFWCELLSSVLHVGLVWFGVAMFGLRGAGMGFFGMYVVQICVVNLIVRSLSGFRWTGENIRIGSTFAILVALVFSSWYFLPHNLVIASGIVLTLATGYYSVKKICTLVPVEKFPGKVRRILAFLKLTHHPARV
ncbi:MAG: O-antigen translocase [Verrucomicrobiales bacterium]|nr:MAG: O-antigen translocase [Verrucomicrobiales bacterium]